MKLLFLDIDGVLNDHTRTPSSWSTIQADKVERLNFILDEFPDVQLVISSAWRHLIINGFMTLKGFERMLLSFGVRCHGRVHGHTEKDGSDLGDYTPDQESEAEWARNGLTWRAKQCHDYAAEVPNEGFVILDDLALDSPNLVQTDGSVGLTREDALRVIDRLRDGRK